MELTNDAINGIEPKWGRMLASPEDYQCLYDNCLGYKDYVEIGSKFGTSAIVAGYAVTGEVHCIEPFGVMGRPNRKDRSGDFVRQEYLEENWAEHHPLDRLVIHKQKNPPWPEKIAGRMFDVGLIDGDHDVSAVEKDWKAMTEHVRYKVLFHDVNPTSWSQISEFFHKTAKLPGWELVEVRGVMGVLARIDP